MSPPAFSTFLPVLVIAILMIIWWRLTLIIVAAVVIAVLVVGVREVFDRFGQQAIQQETVTGPVAGDGLSGPGP